MHDQQRIPTVTNALSFALVILLTSCGEIGSDATQRGTGGPIAAERTLTIGKVEGDPNYLFGAVSSVAVDGAGRIYAADRTGSTVRVYDGQTGNFIAQIGREGDGPGEYRWPGDLIFGPGGRLYIRDTRRITILAADSLGGIPDSVVATWQIPGRGNPLSTRSGVDSSGTYYYPDYRARRDEPPRYFYLVFAGGTHTGDTVHVPQHATLAGSGFASYTVAAGTGRMVQGLSAAPFEPVASWSITRRGTIVGGDATNYVLFETNAAGDTVARITGPRAGPRLIPAGERAESLAALEARIDSLPVPLQEVRGVSDAVMQRRLPERLPAFLSVHIATNGDVWVEQWPAPGESGMQSFDMFSSGGEYLASIRLPVRLTSAPPPFITPEAVYGVTKDPDTNVEQVVKLVYRHPRLRR